MTLRMFGYLTLINIDFYDFISLFSPKELITLRMLGYLILINIDFYDFISLFFP